MQIAEIDFCAPGDADRLFEIEQACFDYPWERQMIEYGLENQGPAAYMKASFKNMIAGYAVLSRDGNLSHLQNVAVLPRFRRLGVAKQLLLAVEVLSEEWGYRRMRLEVRASNRIARDFYAAIGFVYHMRRKNYYISGEDALILVARLPLKIV
jgi:ribosomal-protein-alanine N-acetyltransferase